MRPELIDVHVHEQPPPRDELARPANGGVELRIAGRQVSSRSIEQARLLRPEQLRQIPESVENRGEGVFIGFRQDAIQSWLARPGVQARTQQLLNGFSAWAKAHPGSPTFPGAAYVMLHSLSHLLITAVALDCGYAASSIRERIYALSSGYGILLYTASPDAEGTLGGLVETADRMGRYLRTAVELGQLCSNDPVCATIESEARVL